MSLGYTAEAYEVLDLQTNRVKISKVKQAAVAYADDTTWVAKSKEEMQAIVQISQRFFKFNDIQINSAKLKLLVINSSVRKEERCVMIENFQLQVEKRYSLTRMLGMWLSIEANESLVVKKAKNIIQQFILSL